MPKRGDIREDGMVFVSKNSQCPHGEYWATMNKFLEYNGADWFEKRERMNENVRNRAEHKAGIPDRKASRTAERVALAPVRKMILKEKSRASFALKMKIAPELVREQRRAYYNSKKDCPIWKEKQRLKCARFAARAKERDAGAREQRAKERKQKSEEKKAAKLAARALSEQLLAERKANAPIKKPKVILTPEQRKDRRRDEKRNYKHRRRAIIRGQECKATPSQIRTARAKARGVCHYCKNPSKLTIDHVIPIAKGGAHALHNIVFACHPCNSEKRDLDATAFAAKFGTLIV